MVGWNDHPAVTGLSPRVRGNRPAGIPGKMCRRSIPACAGEPTSWCGPVRPVRVYPRVCGGTSTTVRCRWIMRGLSPRVRGNRSHRRTAPARIGSIPACAGEPCSRSRISWLSGVYPRVCGGTADGMPNYFHRMGLSPRVRGNLLARCPEWGNARSIPACAGEPCTWHFRTAPCRVYPRVCGGTEQRLEVADVAEGLSPRVRGNLLQ